MKRVFLFMVLIIAVQISQAQLIQNGSFGNWQVQNLYEYPEGWFVFDFEDGQYIGDVVEKSTDAYTGSYSVRVNTLLLDGEEVPGLVMYGAPAEEIIPFPFDKTGDTLHFWYKCHIEPGDGAMMLLMLYNNGQVIDSVVNIFTASQANWTHFKIGVNEDKIQPDSMALVFLSTNFFTNPVPGTWLMVDNIYFTLENSPTELHVPNHNFEHWLTATAENPEHWISSNNEHVMTFFDTTNVIKTTLPADYYTPPHAALLQTIEVDGHTFSPFLRTVQAFNAMPDKMFFAYKYLPVGSDVAYLELEFFKNGNHAGGANYYFDNEETSFVLDDIDLHYNETPDEIYIRIYGGDNAGTRLYIDDIRFSCVAPHSLFGEFTSPTAIEMTWTPGAGEDEWELEWGTEGFTLGNGNNETILTNPIHTVTSGVNISDAYDFYVRSICDPTDMSGWTGPFTICDAKQVPIVEDFESVNIEATPSCWNIFATGNATAEVNDWGNAYTGHNYLRVNYNQPDKIIVASPKLEDNIEDLYISFYAKKNTGINNVQLKIGTMSNPYAPDSFNEVDSFNLSNNHQKFSHYFLNYSGTDEFIAIKLHTTEYWAEAYIDDLIIDYIPSCIPPLNLEAGSITLSSAEVSWDAGGQSTWHIIYGETGFDPATEGTTEMNLSSPSYTITPLNSGTTYDVYVQADCGGGDLSDWSKVSFTTLCTDFSVPITEDFENITNDIPNCWEKLIIGWGEIYVTPWGGLNWGPALNLRLHDPSDTLYVITPAIVENLEDLFISFHAYEHTYDPGTHQGNAIFTLGTITDPTDATTFNPLQQFSLTDNHQNFQYVFDSYSGTDNYIAFQLTTDDYNYTEIFIDEVLIDLPPTCFMPQNINVMATSTEADVTWQPGDTETLWNLIYAFEWEHDWLNNGTLVSGIDVTNHTITSLMPDHYYSVYLQSDCGGGDLSAWTSGYNFYTPCELITANYYYDFDDINHWDMPLCWHSIHWHNDGSPYVGIDDISPYSSPNHIYIYNGEHTDPSAFLMMVTPELEDVNDKQLRFFAKASIAGTTLDIGTVDHYHDPTTFNSIATINLTENYTDYIVPLDALHGDTRMAFSHGMAGHGDERGIFIDNFAFEYFSTCPSPTQVTFTSTTKTTVLAEWVEPGIADEWEIEWGQEGFALGSGIRFLVSPDEYHLFDNLDTYIGYDFYIRSVCAPGDTSHWSGPHTFNAALVCEAGAIYGQAPGPFENFILASKDFDNRKIAQSFSGITDPFSALKVWSLLMYFDGGFTECFIQPMDFEVEFYEDNYGQMGAMTNSFTLSVVPDSTFVNAGGGQQIYEVTLELPELINLTDGWFTVTSVNSPSCFAWLGSTLNPNATGDMYRIIPGDTLPRPYPLAYCFYYDPTACLLPTQLTVSDIGADTAVISWAAGHNESQWNVEWGLYNFVQGTGTQYNGLTTQEIKLSGLAPSTMYSFYVQADCGSGVHSDWAGPYSFTSECSLEVAPFTETFEDPLFPPLCWETVSGSGDWQRSTDAGAYGTSTASALAEFHNIQHSTPFDLVSLTFDASILTAPYLSFDYAYAYYDVNFYDHLDILYSTDGGASYNLLFAMSGIDALNTAGQHGGYFIPNPSQWATQELQLPVGTNRIKFTATSGWGNNLYIDNISVDEAPSCPTPTNHTVTNITQDAAQANWDSSAGEYEIEYGMAPYTFSGTPSVTGITDEFYEFTSLNHSTTYLYRVKALCGLGSESNWSTTYSFTTECDIYHSFFEDFDNTAFGNMPLCWSAINIGNPDGFVGAHNYMHYSYPNSLMLYNSSNQTSGAELLAVTPELFDMNQHQVRFVGATQLHSSIVEVGSMSDPTDPATFTMLQSFNLDNYFVEFYLSLAAVPPTDSYLAFRHPNPDADNNEGIFIDNFSYEMLESCPYPTALSSTPVSTNSVQLSWTENANATQWQILWGEIGFPYGGGDTITVTDNPFVLDNLSPNTYYEFSVRSICDPVAGDTSYWSNPHHFGAQYMCVPNTVYGQRPEPIEQYLWSSQDMGLKIIQSFSNVNSVFDGLHLWGVQAFHDGTGAVPCSINPMDLEVTFFEDNNGFVGNQHTSFVVSVTPDTTNSQVAIFEILEFTLQFPEVIDLSEGWFSVRSVNAPSCFSLFAITSSWEAEGMLLSVNNNNDTSYYDPLAFCFVDNTHIVNYSAGPNGSIAGAHTQIVPDGGASTPVEAIPDPCYEFIQWSDSRTDNPRFDFPVHGDINVTAIFDLINIEHHTTEEICHGDTFYFGDMANQILTTPGPYTGLFITTEGCDSTVHLNLIVNPIFEFTDTVDICYGDTLLWRNNTYTATGIYYDSLQTVHGCDSVFVLDLTVNPVFEFTDTVDICYGDTLLWRNSSYTSTGIYYDSLQTVHGCDSVFVLDLTVNPVFEFTDTVDICYGDTLLWRNSSYTSTGIYYDSLQTIHGCDSVFVLDLTVNPVFVFTDTAQICYGDTFLWRNNTYTATGIYYDSLQSIHGCDSIFILDLYVHTVDVSVTQNGNELTAEASNATFQWVDCDDNFSPISGATNALFVPTVNGNYAVIVTQNNCTDTSACFAITDVFASALHKDMEINIYPNPNDGYFIVEIYEESLLTLYNALGAVVYEGKFSEGKHSFHFDNLSNGVYFLKAEGDRSRALRKIIINR